jgi:hypothetical protein
LGIVIDDRLSWNRQNEEQCNKISKNINLLRKVKDFVGLDTLKIMYNALAMPHFNYCSTNKTIIYFIAMQTYKELITVQLFGKITTKHT